MKKFLTKKASMIGSIVAAALVFILLVAFCVRPVSVGYTYKGEFDLMGMGAKSEMTMHFNNFDKMTAVVDMEGVEVEMKLWYFVKDGVICIGGFAEDVKVAGTVIYEATSKEDFKDLKKETLKDWDAEAAREEGMLINAFKMTSNSADESLVCGGAIATVIVLSLVDIALAGFAIASVVLSRKKEA